MNRDPAVARDIADDRIRFGRVTAFGRADYQVAYAFNEYVATLSR